MSYDGLLAAMPLAASLALLVGQWLPVRFVYRENELGIVSIATQQRYPVQQETFWLVFGVGLASVLSYAIALGLRGRCIATRRVIALEVLGLASLLAALWLPAEGAAPCVAIALAAALWFARKRAVGVPTGCDSTGQKKTAARSDTVLWIFGSLVLAVLLVPGIWGALWNVVNGVPDRQLLSDSFRFQAEIGQHLSWAQALADGQLHGRDFFCLYGPLYDWTVVGLWELLGRGVATWNLYWWIARIAGWLSFFLLAGLLVKRRALVLLLPFVLPLVSLRIGLAFLAFAALIGWLRSGRIAFCAIAGFVGGASLLYSQEYGLAFAMVAVLCFAIHRGGRAALVFSAGMACAVVPVFGYYAANDALLPMLSDLAQYPRYVMAGYAKLPFPAIERAIMIDALALGPVASEQLRIGYALPVLFTAALLQAVPITRFDLGKRIASMGSMLRNLVRDHDRLAWVLVALFGLICFRSALGRSDRTHFIAIAPAAALLLGVALDRAVESFSHGRRGLGVWRVAALLLLVLHTGFVEIAQPLENARGTVTAARVLWAKGNHPVGDENVESVVLFIRNQTTADDAVLFLPNAAAYYYLTERRYPTRFVLGSQLVTEAHRSEFRADLVADPPAFVVWDDAALRVDGLSDEVVFGGELLAWIDAHYVEVKRFGAVRILAPRRVPAR